MHTPRLCIDGRIAYELPFGGLVAQDVIDQLVSATGEPDVSSDWLERKRTVLLTHPQQVFSGQLKRHNTSWNVGRSPLHLLWERYFEKNANVSAFHRFRPIDRLTSTKCPTVTTLLPPKKGMPLFVSRRRNHEYVVPCEKDARFLEKQYSVERAHISVLKPSPRRYVHFVDRPSSASEGNILVLVDEHLKPGTLEKLKHVFQLRYRHFPLKLIPVTKKNAFSPTVWTKLLGEAKMVLYLVSQPFDWATLALESIYWEIPTLFADEHATLNELLPHSELKLSHFLVNQPELAQMQAATKAASQLLREQGVFDPLSTARQYRKVYEKLPTAVLSPGQAEITVADEGCCGDETKN